MPIMAIVGLCALSCFATVGDTCSSSSRCSIALRPNLHTLHRRVIALAVTDHTELRLGKYALQRGEVSSFVLGDSLVHFIGECFRILQPPLHLEDRPVQVLGNAYEIV